tara:strand:+ start:360 stop:1175 length:816 start_codon:yes stop_codon:yes gene_type:complete
MRSVKFIKMQGLGNDFVIFFWDEPLPPKSKIKVIANRKKGVGCDLLVFLKKSDNKLVNYEANFFNSDGSEAEICGNALRCVGKLLFEKTQIKNSLIETKAGLIDVEYINEKKVTVNIGVSKFKWQEIPMSKNMNHSDLSFNNKYLKTGFALNIGNPHLIFFSEELDISMIESDAKKILQSNIFPDGVNISVVKINSEKKISIITFERGVGITAACGTGACASVIAANKKNFVEKKVVVEMKGGILEVEISEDNNILMTGAAERVFDGNLNL